MSALSIRQVKKIVRKALFPLASLLFFLPSSAQVYEEYLLSRWTFKAAQADIWLPAEVPGSLQSDLQLNGREGVATPMDGTWLYNTHFIADEHILDRDYIELVFKGLDTHADVYLNDELVHQANNMFRSWVVPVKNKLRKGENKLQISFKTNKASFDPSVRKASYHFELPDSSYIPLGISKPVILRSWNTFRVTNTFIKQNQINGKEASLAAVIDLQGAANSTLQVEIYDEITNRTFKRQQIDVQEANQQLEIPFTIRNPKLWWPISMGDQNLYVIGIRVKGGSNEQIAIERIGLREVEILASGNDSIPSISINGKPVALNGINYLPPKLLSSQMSSDDYDLIFEEIIDNNLNAIHVSGKGIYESEYFYDLADTKGILILQDFMFSKTSYPSSQPFIKNVEGEVAENINLLKQHPSLISWTGTFVGDSQKPNTTLETIIREQVELLDPLRPLLHSGLTDQWVDSSLNR